MTGMNKCISYGYVVLPFETIKDSLHVLNCISFAHTNSERSTREKLG